MHSNRNEKQTTEINKAKDWILQNISDVNRIILSTTSLNEDGSLKDRILIGVVSSHKDKLKIRRTINKYNRQSNFIMLCFIPAGEEEYFEEMKGGTTL